MSSRWSFEGTFKSAFLEAAQLKRRAPQDLAGTLGTMDAVLYHVENLVASNAQSKFYMLGAATIFLLGVCSVCWVLTAPETVEPRDAAYLVFQILAAGGYDNSITSDAWAHQLVFLVTLLMGLLVFAVLGGFVNESVSATMDSLNRGKTNVATSGHTLILGWNESTVRVVCQIALLRRAFLMQNETWYRRVCWWARAVPSTPVAAATVVILCNVMDKAETPRKQGREKVPELPQDRRAHLVVMWTLVFLPRQHTG